MEEGVPPADASPTPAADAPEPAAPVDAAEPAPASAEPAVSEPAPAPEPAAAAAAAGPTVSAPEITGGRAALRDELLALAEGLLAQWGSSCFPVCFRVCFSCFVLSFSLVWTDTYPKYEADAKAMVFIFNIIQSPNFPWLFCGC